MTEEAIAPLPTRQQELEYLDFLEKSISTDPIFTIRPNRYSAGPKRLRWKAMTEMRHEYRKTFFLNFCQNSILLLPLTI